MCGIALVPALRAAGFVEEVPITCGRFYRRTKRLHAALENLRQSQFKSKTAAIRSISRNTLLEHGAPLMARCLTDKIIELGVLPAGSGIASVCSTLRNYPEEFVRLPERRFWIAGEPLGT
jgi:hypothetical protein